MSSAVEQIKARLSIIDVVGSYIKLDKAGTNYKAKCPFHNEKTPSFYVSPGRESYHCFGCDKGGDIFSFVEELEGVDFIGALKILAEKAGVKLENEDKYEKSEKGRTSVLLTSAIEFYRRELVKNTNALNYLKGRGLKGETVTKFKIGYAPDDWRAVGNYLKKQGFSDDEIEKAGLSIKSPSGSYDRFRGRIMFPVYNISGSPIGFSGRIFEPKITEGKQEPAKYINTPQTVVYDKSRALFGIDKAKVEMRKKNECILVEGQFDLIMAHQAGTENTVAVSGTALTEDHLMMINRLAEKLTMAFDGDSAGLKASARAIGLALSLEMDVRLVSMGNAKDPADVIKDRPEDWLNAVENSKHIVDFFLDSLTSHNLTKDVFSKQVKKQVLPYVKSIKSRIEQAKFVNKISELLKVTEGAVWEDLKETVPAFVENNGVAVGKEIKQRSPNENTKEFNLKKMVWSFLEWQKDISIQTSDQNKKNALGDKEQRFRELIKDGEYEKIDRFLSPKRNQLILEVEIPFSGATNLEKEIDSALDSLEEEILKNEVGTEWLKIKEAEKNGNAEKVAIHMTNFQKMSKRLDEFKKRSA
ncbi:MAG: primase protein [Parcubacteria group bacterium GW2011_GWF2_38_76]|nr:MAG: primase protein [Parcubacteria group bacterium GW2011_GWF2_38_76]HBM46068.1 DNA primase [Patescibacteria group bacterium]